MIIIDELRYLVRIMLALGLGFAIGFERKIRNKEAGIRTHTIVSVGSCLFMLISKYGFTDVGETDGARIAAQIVSGIGFLGAGGHHVPQRRSVRGDDGCGHMGDGRNRHGGGRGTIHIGGRDLAARDFYPMDHASSDRAVQSETCVYTV